jgi:Zn-dependent M16 (insulinase) family peptidase
MHSRTFLLKIALLLLVATNGVLVAEDLSHLTPNQNIAGFRVANLFADSTGKIVGAKFSHNPSGAPIYVLQIDTAPQTFIWIDAPATSNRGVAHSLEHILAKKGTKGRYFNLLRTMRLSQSGAATYEDYNLYCLTSGVGMPGFMDQFHALMEALFKPDFSDTEAEREFYHFGVSTDSSTHERTLVEQGTVYNEMKSAEGIYTYFFELNKQVFGESNPFGFNIGGDPSEMRGVRPVEIRQFHDAHYRLGQGTGFIFVFPAKEDVASFLARISGEFERLPQVEPPARETRSAAAAPKYPVKPSASKEPKIYPFPSSSELDRGEIRFGWVPVAVRSQVDLRLRQLLMRALADGEQSLLYKSLVDTKTKELDSEATSIEASVSLESSPWLPAEFIGLRGIPGNHISAELIERFRNHIGGKIAMISGYQDDSTELQAFNRLVVSYAKAWKRDQRVWIKSAPLFSTEYRTDWKEHLNYLEMDSSFVRSLSDEKVWEGVEQRIQSGKNLWRQVIHDAHLLDTPYATASVPSHQLVTEIEADRQRRIQDKLKQLEQVYGVTHEQEALARYEQAERKKTAEIDKLDAQIARPRFTEHPPLTNDDDVQYRQFQINSVPVIAVLFDGTPTVDIGLSFDLRALPPKYYKYLPMLPRFFDSVGLRTPDRLVSYADLMAQTQKNLSSFSIDYDSNAISRREDLAIRGSAASLEDFEHALTLISETVRFSNIDLSNLDRLQDLVDERLAEEDRYGKGEDSSWFWGPAQAFRHQDDALYLALNSHYTQSHWDSRLKWLVHRPVHPDEIDRLTRFADQTLASLQGLSAGELSNRLSQMQLTGLEKELVSYWQRSIASFPENELIAGLRQLTTEVRHDLTVGPAQTIQELKELRDIIIDPGKLKVDITIDPGLLDQARPALSRFLQSLPHPTNPRNVQEPPSASTRSDAPIMRRIERRAGVGPVDYPWYVGLQDSPNASGGAVFSSDFIGYSQLKHDALITVLSSKIGTGSAPHSFHMKALEAGLAYANSVSCDPSVKLLWYYADRVPDLAALVQLVNSYAATIPEIRDPTLLDYVLQKSFPFPRSMSTFTDRGKQLAQDIYDGNDPRKIRRFSEEILNLRSDPNLQSEIMQASLRSIAPVLLRPGFEDVQRSDKSIFFLVGPERLLSDAEKRLRIPRLLRLYPSDFWVE